ncbi:MAG: AAA family ATPase [Anaerolineales bacterium]
MLEARFLGKFEIRIDGTPIEIPARKAQTLLAYLLMNSADQFRREQLAGMLWPDYDESSARSKLRYSLWQLRSALGEDFFIANKVTLAFNFESSCWVDSIELEEDTSDQLAIDQLEQLVGLYQGEFLPGFYEDWILLERDQLRAVFDNKISLLLQQLSNQGRWREVLEWAEKWISFGQLPEPAFQALMIAHSRLGDKASAAKAYLRIEQSLKEELEVEPADKTKVLYERILRGEVPGLSVENITTGLLKPQHPPLPYSMKDTEYLDLEQRPFVAREKELAWLDERLNFVLEGDGQLAFIVGDAGQGKTTLLRKFSQLTQDRWEDLVIAYATCEAFSGIGDPYLPFRNILALLAGDVAAKQSNVLIDQENAQRLWEMLPYTCQAILDFGPDLLDSLISGEMLIRCASSYTFDRPAWLKRLDREVDIRRSRPFPINIDHGDSEKDLLDQYARVLQTLSHTRPLVLILDDLQWADHGTCELLFHLARRIEGQGILILGSYRPADINQEWEDAQHPFAKMLPELKRKFGKMEIDLDHTDQVNRQRFVDEYLNSEPNSFDDKFKEALYQHTAGHPLFTVELLRQMEDQGVIFKNEQGRWVVSDDLSWGTMPVKVEAVIEGRINRLPSELREILNIACVEGEEFSAELIASVTGLEISSLINSLSRDLARQHNLIEVSEIKYVNHRRLSVYRFQHSLYRQYLYENLDIAELAYLHEKIGNELEQLYGDEKDLIAVQLAEHFELSGVNEKAVNYLLVAGRNAKRVSANEQAITHLSSGLEMIQDLPEGEKRDEFELALQISLGPPLVATEGYASLKAERAFERARELCEQIGDNQQLAPALWGLCAFYQVRGKHLRAHEMANQILGLAENKGGNNLKMLAHWMLGLTYTHLGEFSTAKDQLESALHLYDSKQDNPLTYLYGQNPRVTCLNYLALNLWLLGYLDQALERCQEAISVAEKLFHPYSLTFAHGMAAMLHSLRREPQSALLHGDEAYKLAKKSHFPFFLFLGMTIRGWARIQMKKSGMAFKLIENGITGMHVIGAELARPYFLSLQAEAFSEEENILDGVKMIFSALNEVESSQELWYLSGLYCLYGDLLARQGESEDEIFAHYWRAIQIAEKQNAKSLAMRAAIALVNFNQKGLHADEAKEVLNRIYRSFDEGLDDELLIEARGVLNPES